MGLARRAQIFVVCPPVYLPSEGARRAFPTLVAARHRIVFWQRVCSAVSLFGRVSVQKRVVSGIA